jgi:hypothetical protein
MEPLLQCAMLNHHRLKGDAEFRRFGVCGRDPSAEMFVALLQREFSGGESVHDVAEKVKMDALLGDDRAVIWRGRRQRWDIAEK